MKKTKLIIFILGLLFLIFGIFILLKFNIISFSNLSSSIKTEEKIIKYDNFIILPFDYSLSIEEENYIVSNNIKDIFFVKSTSSVDIASSTTEFLSTTTVKFHKIDEDSEIQICNKAFLDKNEIYELNEYDIVSGNCAKNTQIIKVNQVKCLSELSTCIPELSDLLHKDNVYLYLNEEPFIKNFQSPSINIEQTNGLVKILWDDTVLPMYFSQHSYSLEYLDESGERIDAFGLIERQNIGDIYIPPQEFSGKEILAKLRIWYKYKDITFTFPEEISESFKYTGYTKPVLVPNNEIIEGAWVPEWGTYDGILSIQKNPTKYKVISPTWYVPNTDGTLAYQYSYYNNELESVVRSYGIKLVPTIMLFDADILKEILRNNMDNHINSIVNEVNICGYDGIDLDYESTYVDDTDLLVEFVTKLTDKLHENGKTITFTALSKIDDRQIYSSFPQTHQAQDWERIGKIVDEFRIMAYDYTGQSSKKAGPISPIIWNEAIITYALEKVPKEKIVLALPLYSHAWQVTDPNPVGENNDVSMYLMENNSLSWQHDDIDYVRLNSDSYNEVNNDWYGETFVSLNYKGIYREMYYLSPSDIKKRIEMAKAYGIKGVYYWRIGGDQL